MLGRTPGHIQAIRPLKDGVIADFDICEKMLRYFIQRVHQQNRWAKPRMVICIPSGITGVERRAVQEAAEYAGARKPVMVIEEPMAAAIGAGLPVHEPAGNMIVDIGGGTSEVAVISMGGIVAARVEPGRAATSSTRRSSRFMKREYSLALGERTAEEVKVKLASAYPLEEEFHAEIRGRDLVTGLPRTVVVSTQELREAIEEPVAAIIDAIKVTLDKTPPELAADVMERGIMLAGGGSLLLGLDRRDRSRDGHAVPAGEERAVHRRARLGPVPRAVRRAAPGADQRARRLTGVTRLMVVQRHDTRHRSVLFLAIFTSLLLVIIDSRGNGVVDTFRGLARDVIAPVQDVVDTAFTPVRDLFGGITDYGALREENAELKRELAEAQGKLDRERAVGSQVGELEKLLDLPTIEDATGVAARVIGGAPGNFERTVQINKGTSQGIDVGQPVVAGNGLVGKVTASSRTHATVTLIDNPGFGIGVRLENSLERGIAEGRTGEREMRLNFLQASSVTGRQLTACGENDPPDTCISKGEFVFTSAVEDAAFPPTSRSRRSRPSRRRPASSRRRSGCGRWSTSTTSRTSRCCAGRSRSRPNPLRTVERVAVRRVRLVLLVVTLVVFQTTVFPHLRVFDAVPMLLLVATSAMAFEEGPQSGAAFGFASGLAIDLFLASPAGLSALSYAVTGYVLGVFQGGFVRDTRMIAPVLGAVAGLLGGVIFLVVGGIVGEPGYFTVTSRESCS